MIWVYLYLSYLKLNQSQMMKILLTLEVMYLLVKVFLSKIVGDV